MKVLFVASITPFTKGGGAQATLSYLDATLDIFGRENVIVMIANEAIIPEDYSDIQYLKIKKRNRFQKYYDYFKNKYSRFTQPLINYVYCNKDEIGQCIINGGVSAGIATPVLKKLGIKTTVIHHNYEVEYHRDNKTIESIYGRYLFGIRKAEMIAYKNASLNLFLTNQDIALFKNNYGECNGKIGLIGCFDVKHSEVVSILNIEKKYDIVISGSLATFQTYVGIEDFDNKYFKIVSREIKNVKILLTGRSPSVEIYKIQKNKPDSYTIVPNPQKILPIVQSGLIYICPTCIGGGLKLRAMDGLKCGLPVLVHEISARGYDFFVNKSYFKIYNDERSFSIGLKEIISFLKNTHNSNVLINKDYYEVFGYNKGLERMKKFLLN